MQVYGELAKWRNVGDLEADEVVKAYEARHAEDRGAIFRLPRILGRWQPATGDDPPAASPAGLDKGLIEYLYRDYELPSWVDDCADAVRRAQRRNQRNTAIDQIVLATYSLPIVYLHPEIALTLMGSGQLIQHVERRLDHTREFVDVVSARGALLEPGHSWRWLRKVRLSHAVIRRIDELISPYRPRAGGNVASHRDHRDMLAVRYLQRNKPIATDRPIDQLELSYVLLSFSWVMVDGLKRLGHPMTGRECDDHIRLWAVVGHMLGVADELIPGGPERPPSDAQKMFESFRRALTPPRDDPRRPGAREGHQLVAVLLSLLADVQREAVPPRWRAWNERLPWLDAAIQSLPRTLVRRLCGPEVAETLHVGRPPLASWLLNQLMLQHLDLTRWNESLKQFTASAPRDDEPDEPPRGIRAVRPYARTRGGGMRY